MDLHALTAGPGRDTYGFPLTAIDRRRLGWGGDRMD